MNRPQTRMAYALAKPDRNKQTKCFYSFDLRGSARMRSHKYQSTKREKQPHKLRWGHGFAPEINSQYNRYDNGHSESRNHRTNGREGKRVIHQQHRTDKNRTSSQPRVKGKSGKCPRIGNKKINGNCESQNEVVYRNNHRRVTAASLSQLE